MATVIVACAALLSCGTGNGGEPDSQSDATSPPALFPADFLETGEWTEARDCRHSHEHELRHIRVMAGPNALDSYLALSADEPFVVGATLVKLEYDDSECQNLLGYTAMRREAPGYNPDAFDWHWQKLTPEFEVIQDGVIDVCIGCHKAHCLPPHGDGFEMSCAEEL